MAGIDLRQPMSLAAHAVVRRLDPEMEYRPWFLLRGNGGIPARPQHSPWDLGDMTGRYLESLILARRMGISDPELELGEKRLKKFFGQLIGRDGSIYDPARAKPDHPFAQGSALYGLVAWFEDSREAHVRGLIERMIEALLAHDQREEAKLPQSSGSHLAGYQIFPAVRFYEMTKFAPALELAERLTNWALSDPVLGADGEITLALSWEGHIHSWLDTLAGCMRAARSSTSLDRDEVIGQCRAIYDWVMRTNATRFGWIATFPGHGSCETCAISSAIRLALELERFDDVERFVRNHALEAQFRDLSFYDGGPEPVTPLLEGCFDSQSLPNGHLGTRGGEDVGNVEGCCLNGGMRAIALAWFAAQAHDPAAVTIQMLFSHDGPVAQVIDHQPDDGRVEIIPRYSAPVRIRIPPWLIPHDAKVLVNGTPTSWHFQDGYLALGLVPGGARVELEFAQVDMMETIEVAGETYTVTWRDDTVTALNPPGAREPTYQRGTS